MYKKKQHTTLIRYVGAKNQVAKRIIENFPEHNTFVDVFGGSGAIMFSKSKSQRDVFNDYNSAIAALFACLRNDDLFERLVTLLHNTLVSRETWEDVRDQIRENDFRLHDMNDAQILQWGYLAFVGYNQAVGGKIGNNSGGWSNTCTIPWHQSIRSLDRIRDRLKDVYIENGDFEEVIEKYAKPDTLFYLDPPYTLGERSSGIYGEEMGDIDQYRLMIAITSNPGMFVLSGYDNDLYNSILCDQFGWNKKTYNVKSQLSVASNRTFADRIEVIWLSPNIEQKQLVLL